jgi:ubiquinone/menaquinone biosynthesis C-methylase UbiE
MNIYKFYNNLGWKEKNKVFKDAELFEDLRHNSKTYISKCRRRLLEYIPEKGNHILDFASGPIQYKEYLEYSKNFKLRHCVDFSKTAIREAKKKLGKKGKYYCDDFLKIKFKENFFDCVVSMHTIYHISKNKQKKAVEKLIKVTKKNRPIIIVYSNPNTLINRLKNIFIKKKNKQQIYFFCHPLKWWKQFEGVADIKIICWRSFAAQHQKLLFPNNLIGKMMLNILLKLEKRFPNFFYKNFQYPLIILNKK